MKRKVCYKQVKQSIALSLTMAMTLGNIPITSAQTLVVANESNEAEFQMGQSEYEKIDNGYGGADELIGLNKPVGPYGTTANNVFEAQDTTVTIDGSTTNANQVLRDALGNTSVNTITITGTSVTLEENATLRNSVTLNVENTATLAVRTSATLTVESSGALNVHGLMLLHESTGTAVTGNISVKATGILNNYWSVNGNVSVAAGGILTWDSALTHDSRTPVVDTLLVGAVGSSAFLRLDASALLTVNANGSDVTGFTLSSGSATVHDFNGNPFLLDTTFTIGSGAMLTTAGLDNTNRDRGVTMDISADGGKVVVESTGSFVVVNYSRVEIGRAHV